MINTGTVLYFGANDKHWNCVIFWC